MGFRFRRTFSFFPGVRLNVGATGASVSVGPKGAKITVSPRGVRATAGIPRSGAFLSHQFRYSDTADDVALLPPEVAKIVGDRPPHWELKLLQSSLRSAVDEVNSMYQTAVSGGIDALEFNNWVGSFFPQYTQFGEEWKTVIEADLPTAFGPAGKPGDSELIINAVDRLTSLTREAIILQQQAAALSRHPIFGALAMPLRDAAKPFVDAYNALLRRLDEQLPNIGITNNIDLQLTLQAPPSLHEFSAAMDAYTAKFADEKNHSLVTGDIVKERFQIARGEEALGEFGRNAVTDNLTSGIFRPDDWYWSDDAQEWRPLSKLP